MPDIITVKDKQVSEMTFKKLGKVNSTMYLYVNVKTGCKQCFSVYDVLIRNSEIKA